VGYNHLVTVVGGIVLDMEKAGLSALRMVSEMKKPGRKGAREKFSKKNDPTPREGSNLFENA
jgi:hypothetical protein